MRVRGSGWRWHRSWPLIPDYLYDLETVVAPGVLAGVLGVGSIYYEE
jgi:hypothetical protein